MLSSLFFRHQLTIEDSIQSKSILIAECNRLDPSMTSLKEDMLIVSLYKLVFYPITVVINCLGSLLTPLLIQLKTLNIEHWFKLYECLDDGQVDIGEFQSHWLPLDRVLHPHVHHHHVWVLVCVLLVWRLAIGHLLHLLLRLLRHVKFKL